MLKDKVRDLWYHEKHKDLEADQRPPRVPVRQVLGAIMYPIVNTEAQEDRVYIYCEGGYKDAADHADQRADALGQDDAHPKPSTDSDALRNATPQNAYWLPF